MRVLGERLKGIGEVMGSIPAVSAQNESDEHLLLLHRRLRRESGHLTDRQEPRLEIALVFLLLIGRLRKLVKFDTILIIKTQV